MSKPVFEDLFTFSGRRNRLSYNLFVLADIAVLLVLSTLFILAANMINQGNTAVGYLLMALVVLMFVPVAVAGWAVGSQRVRDFGQSGVWVVLSLIPYVGLAFSIAIMCVPSSEGANKYGPSCIE